MSQEPAAVARAWAHELPRDFALQLAAALRSGRPALKRLRAAAVLPASVQAVNLALDLDKQGDAAYAGGLLEGWLNAVGEQATVTSVWTGPASGRRHGRLTLAVVADLIDEAKRELLMASYATLPGDAVRQALQRAVARGVEVTLLLERSEDNPGFHGVSDPFPGLGARRLHWPLESRPSGASMHAKVLVADRCVALIGSANLTGHGLERNLECGVLIRGGPTPGQLADHILNAAALIAAD